MRMGSLIDMEVAAADGGGSHPDQDIVRGEFRYVVFSFFEHSRGCNPDIANFRRNGGFHFESLVFVNGNCSLL
jgi:hypothetical protein